MITIYSPEGNALIDVHPEERSYRYRAIQGQNTLNLYFQYFEYIDIPVGAYVQWGGAQYTLVSPEALTMHHSRHFEYSLQLEGEGYLLKSILTTNPVDHRVEFHLTAKPHEHIQLLVDNLNGRLGGKQWSVGECIQSDEKLISYQRIHLDKALESIATAFQTEWEIVDKTIHLRKVERGKDNPLPLSYGKGNGLLPGVSRRNDPTAQALSRLYPQTSERNIDPTQYRGGSKSLLLPQGVSLRYDGAKTEWQAGFDPQRARSYSTDEQGLSLSRTDANPWIGAEDSLDCSSIYPQRVGTITAVHLIEPSKPTDQPLFDFEDDTIPEALDYERCLIQGQKMSIIFQTGELAGREFDVSYTHHRDDKRRYFKIISRDGLPSRQIQPHQGDRYAVYHVMLPQSYIREDSQHEGAEWELLRKAVDYYYHNEGQRYTYTAKLDPIWAGADWANRGGRIVLGGYISFSDPRFQPTPTLIRITGIKDYLHDPQSPEIELANHGTGASLQYRLRRLESAESITQERTEEALSYGRRGIEQAQEVAQRLSALSLEGFTEQISPVAVQAMQASFGSRAGQFDFVGGRGLQPITPRIRIEQGKLTIPRVVVRRPNPQANTAHTLGATSPEYQYLILEPYQSAPLTESLAHQPYYLYILTEGQERASWMLSESPLASDDHTLLVGILSSADKAGERSFAPLYGLTEILPGQIRTSTIVSADGKTSFNLEEGVIQGRIKFFNPEDNTYSDIEYLRKGLRPSTEIQGGMVLTNVVAVKDQEGAVNAYLSGDDQKPAIRTGVAHFNTPQETANITLNHDGSAHFGRMSIEKGTGQVSITRQGRRNPYIYIGEQNDKTGLPLNDQKQINLADLVRMWEEDFRTLNLLTGNQNKTPLRTYIGANMVSVSERRDRFVRLKVREDDGQRANASPFLRIRGTIDAPGYLFSGYVDNAGLKNAHGYYAQRASAKRIEDGQYHLFLPTLNHTNVNIQLTAFDNGEVLPVAKVREVKLENGGLRLWVCTYWTDSVIPRMHDSGFYVTVFGEPRTLSDDELKL